MSEPGQAWLLAVAGLVVGSFLNVCIYRLPRGGSIVTPPSRCPSCERPLRWFDNIPIVGYLRLGGRCRACRVPISPMYPTVEAATSALFLLQYSLVGVGPLLAARLVFSCAMIVLCMIDLRHRVLPNVITLPGAVVGLLCSLFLPPGWVDAVIGVVVGGGSLLVISEAYYRIRGEEGLGMGDVKMLAMIGAFLGWQSMLVTLLLASLLGSMVGVGMIVWSGRHARYALPLGSFLAVASIVVTAVGEPFIAWYVSFY